MVKLLTWGEGDGPGTPDPEDGCIVSDSRRYSVSGSREIILKSCPVLRPPGENMRFVIVTVRPPIGSPSPTLTPFSVEFEGYSWMGICWRIAEFRSKTMEEITKSGSSWEVLSRRWRADARPLRRGVVPRVMMLTAGFKKGNQVR